MDDANQVMAGQLSERIRRDILALSAFYNCRLEVSSDQLDSLGHFCFTASTKDREKQGFGSSALEAVTNLRTQPPRGSTGKRS